MFVLDDYAMAEDSCSNQPLVQRIGDVNTSVPGLYTVEYIATTTNAEQGLSWSATDDTPATLTYQLSGAAGNYTLFGLGTFDDETVSVFGDNLIIIIAEGEEEEKNAGSLEMYAKAEGESEGEEEIENSVDRVISGTSVTLTVTPKPGTLTWHIKEIIPEGLLATNVSGPGSASNNWGTATATLRVTVLDNCPEPLEGEDEGEDEGEGEGEGEDDECTGCRACLGCCPDEDGKWLPKDWMGDWMLIGLSMLVLAAYGINRRHL